MSMTPKAKALQLRQLARDKQAAQEREAALADQRALTNAANELMCKALDPFGGETNTFTVHCKKHHAERIVAILVAEGFTEENFWEVSHSSVSGDKDYKDCAVVTASVILT